MSAHPGPGRIRRLILRALWGLLIRMWCRSFTVVGADNLPDAPVLVVANHASHADTVVLQFALSLRHQHPVLVAGAEDYWFSNGLRSVIATALGVFPFPRQGEFGVDRAQGFISEGSTVILFPQGSRNGGPFRPGVGRIARATAVDVVPVHISGTAEILPRGQAWPHRGDVTVSFSQPVTIRHGEHERAFAYRLERLLLPTLRRAA